MSETVVIYTRDPDFYMLMAHILAAAGYHPRHHEAKPDTKHEIEPSTLAVLIDTSDDIEPVIDFCAELKARTETAQIRLIPLIRARDEAVYFRLLKAGIDEGFMRPVSPDRIIAYLNGLSGMDDQRQSSVVERSVQRFGIVDVEHETRVIRTSGRSTQLSPTEFRILMRLFKTPGHVVTRNALIESAWPHLNHVSPRTVDVHIANLRRALLKTTGIPMIRTIRSNGYMVDFDR